MGNHEESVDVYGHEISEGDDVVRERVDDTPYRKWIRSLRKYYKTDKQIFVHAGILEVEEEGEEYIWESGTPDHIFYGKYPPQTGHFYMDIIAGHTGTATISGDPSFHGIFYDGAAHYYIDGSVCESGEIPVLMYDTDTEKYYKITQKRDGRSKTLFIRSLVISLLLCGTINRYKGDIKCCFFPYYQALYCS